MAELIPYPVQPNTIYNWDALTMASTMKACGMRVNCVVTSPPYYGLRNYNVDGQIGLEPTPDAYVRALVTVFRAIRDVLTDDGTVWLNLGDTFSNAGKWGGSKGYNNKQSTNAGSIRRTSRNAKDIGAKEKNLLMIPARVALALQADGWYLRSDIIWSKPNPMPESVTDRPTKSHEYLFLLSKRASYYYDAEAIKENAVDGDPTPPRGSGGVLGMLNEGRRDKQGELGKRTYTGFNERWDHRDEPLTKRNKRDVWTIATQPFAGAHFAVMPQALVEPCVLAGCPVDGVVFDPFAGAGTVAVVARKLGRQYVGSEINADYVALARERLRNPFEQHHVTRDNDLSGLPLFTQEQPA